MTDLKNITTEEHAEKVRAMFDAFELGAVTWELGGNCDCMFLCSVTGNLSVNERVSRCWISYNISGMYSVRIGDTYNHKYEVSVVSENLDDIKNAVNEYYAMKEAV